MALATSLVTIVVYIVIPTIFAATTYSRSSLDIADTNEQTVLTVGRKLRAIHFLPKHVNPSEQSTMSAERKFGQVYPQNPAKPNAQSLARAGRKLSEIDYPIDLGDDFYRPISVPVMPGVIRRNLNFRRNPAFNHSRKPYQTVPVRGSRQGSSKGTQHIADLENGLLFEERTPLSTSSSSFRPRPRLPVGPYVNDIGLER